MNRNVSLFAAAAALLGAAAAPAIAQDRYEAVLVGSGENLSVRHIGTSVPVSSGHAAVLTGSGENVTAVNTGASTQNFATSGGTAMSTGSGENQSVIYVPATAPSSSFASYAGASRG